MRKSERLRAGKNEEKRTLSVSVRFSPTEMKKLDNDRKTLQRGTYLRCVWQGRPPAHIPRINAEAYGKLSRAAANLNQVIKYINAGQYPKAEILREALDVFRLALIEAEMSRREGK